MSDRNKKTVVILLTGILFFGLFSCGRPAEGEKSDNGKTLFEVGQRKILLDLAIKEGRPLIIHLGMGMCQDCIEAEEIIHNLALAYKGRILTMEINIADEPETAEEFEVDLIPTIVVIDPSGKESYRHEGRVDKIKLQRAINKSL